MPQLPSGGTVKLRDGPPWIGPPVSRVSTRRHGVTGTSCRGPVTWKSVLLIRVLPGMATCTVPVVAPAGTVVVISEADTTLNVAGVPLKLTLVAPVRFVPRMVTGVPTAPMVGCVSTKGGRPVDILKTVPDPLVQ